MKPRLLTGLVVIAATFASASTLDSGLLAPYVRSMQAVEGLDVTYSVNQVGGTLSEHRVVLARPDKAMVDSATVTVYADGTNVTTFFKSSNTYIVKKQSAASLGQLLADGHLSLWMSYFDPNALDAVASTKNEGTRTRKGETLYIVSAQLDANGRASIRLHLGQKDNLIRQAEITTTVGLTAATSILAVDAISTVKPADDRFVFKPRADSKLLTERDLRISEYRKLLSVAKADRVKVPGATVASITFSRIRPSNEHLIETYTNLFLKEFSKYPLEFVRASKLKEVVLVEQLAVDGQFRAAVPGTDTETLYYDVTYMRDPLYCRNVVHHEYFHMLDEEWNGNPLFSRSVWTAFNEPGFKYGTGGKDAYGKGDVSSYVHPFKGFLNLYSTYGLEEDKAVIWAMLFVPELYAKGKPLLDTDPILRAKVGFLHEFARSKCPEIDDAFWKQVSGDPSAVSP